LRVYAQAAAKHPSRIVFDDQVLREFHDIARKRQPVKVCDDNRAARLENPLYFLRGFGTVKPMPTLTGRDNVKR
jgi:hypothetical protein